MSSDSSEGRFNKALEDLQVNLRIMPSGVSDAGSWHYSYIYDCTHRRFPQLVEQAGKITEMDARDTLVDLYLTSVGAAQSKEIERLFRWRSIDVLHSTHRLFDCGRIMMRAVAEKPDDVWLLHSDFIHSCNV